VANGLSLRVESRRSRSAIARAISSTSPPDSATRRRARTSGLAVRKTFKVASGNTTVPMSRPSTTPPPRDSTHSRCALRSIDRTPLNAATWLTAALIRWVRISAVTSAPSTTTRPGESSIRVFYARAATSPSLRVSTPSRNAANVTARYIAPVSRYGTPRRSARSWAMVDLPAPAGPSIATTRIGTLTSSCPVGDPRRIRQRSARRPRRDRGIGECSTPLHTCTPSARRRRFGRRCPRLRDVLSRDTCATC